MNNLFKKEDVLTGVTADQAVLGTKGFFANNLDTLTNRVEMQEIHMLSQVCMSDGSCFVSEFENHYTLFLPLDKVKKPTYRPLKNVDELFDFFYPPKDDVYSQTEKAEILLGEKIVLKKLENDQIKAMVIQDIEFNNNTGNVYINNLSIDYIFHVYDIEKDGKWQPFGVKE